MLHPLSTDSGVWPKSALVGMQHGGPFERTVSATVRKEAQVADAIKTLTHLTQIRWVLPVASAMRGATARHFDSD